MVRKLESVWGAEEHQGLFPAYQSNCSSLCRSGHKLKWVRVTAFCGMVLQQNHASAGQHLSSTSSFQSHHLNSSASCDKNMRGWRANRWSTWRNGDSLGVCITLCPGLEAVTHRFLSDYTLKLKWITDTLWWHMTYIEIIIVVHGCLSDIADISYMGKPTSSFYTYQAVSIGFGIFWRVGNKRGGNRESMGCMYGWHMVTHAHTHNMRIYIYNIYIIYIYVCTYIYIHMIHMIYIYIYIYIHIYTYIEPYNIDIVTKLPRLGY